MPDELTPNYNLLCPKPEDTMSQQLTPTVPGLIQNLRDAYERFEAAANPTVIANPPLPQAGDYKVGDRVYLSNATYRSSFVLLSKDPNWGWIWRPVQAGISPWISVPPAAFSGVDGFWFVTHPTSPLQFALDNKSNCYWRGAIRRLPLGIVPNNSQTVFATLPNGLKHHTSGMYTLAIDPATPQAEAGIAGYKGGRWYIQNDGFNSLRFHNSVSAQDVYFTGVEYVVSNLHYYDP